MVSTDSMEFRSSDSRLGLRIDPVQQQRMLALCRRRLPNETGGILVGFYTANLDCAVVSHVSGAPADSRSGRSWFHRGVRGLQQWVDDLWQRQEHYYLGEWHFHPFAAPSPSTTDINQMKGIAESESYHCPEPVLLIIGGNPDGPLEWAAYVFPRGESFVALTRSAVSFAVSP